MNNVNQTKGLIQIGTLSNPLEIYRPPWRKRIINSCYYGTMIMTDAYFLIN